MKHFGWFVTVVLMVLVGVQCSPGAESQTTSPMQPQDSGDPIADLDTSTVEAGRPIASPVPIDTFPRSTPLAIYPCYPVAFQRDNPFAFIPLCEAYRWSEHPDSQAVADRYLGMVEYENDNYHTLDSPYRKRFLKRCQMDDADQVFVYNLDLDSIATYTVAELSVVAFVTPYGTQGQVRQEDYLLGFQLEAAAMASWSYERSLVYVGRQNPFLKGQMKPIVWQVSKENPFSRFTFPKEDSSRIYKKDVSATLYHEQEGKHYYLNNLGSNTSIGGRHLAVLDSARQQLIFSHAFIDSEGCDLNPLSGIDTAYKGQPMQFTGQLFNNRPPVIMGFMSWSFGCPRIHFLAQESPPVFIRCDNRH